MRVVGTVRTVLVYSLAIVGVLTVLFVVASYGWDGEPPEVSLAGTEE